MIFDGTGDEGAGATIGVQGDGLGDQYSFNQAGAVVGGSSVVFSKAVAINPSFTFQLPIIDDPMFEATEDFSIVLANPVTAGMGADTATTTIDISDNSPPVAVDDTVGVLETSNTSINVITAGAGDTDAEGHTLTLTSVDGAAVAGPGTQITLASGAIVTANPNGSVTYDPNGVFISLAGGATANDSFTYEVDDGFGGTDTATVNVTITGENQAAFVDLNDDGTTPAIDRLIYFQATDGPLVVADANATIIDPDDTDFQSLVLLLSGFLQPGNEIVSIDTFQLSFGTVRSGTVAIAGTTFSISYDGANQIIIGNSTGFEIPRSDMEAMIRSITYDNNSSNDTPGIREITFALNDGDGVTQTSKTDVSVVGNNIDPVASDDGTVTPFDTQEDTAVIIPVATLVANDSDPDGDSFDISAVDGGLNGTAVLDGLGNVVFTPATDFNGTTSFTYTLLDSRGGTDTGTVFVNVTPVNDAPSVDLDGATGGSNYSFTYTENDPASPIIETSGLLTDVDSSQLVSTTITLVNGEIGDMLTVGTLPPGITATVNPPEAATGLSAAGTVTVTLSGLAATTDYDTALRAVGFAVAGDRPVAGDRTITVRAGDGSLDSAVATATVTVVAVNDLPDTGVDGPFNVDEDDFTIIPRATLLANDIDADGDTVTLVSVDNPVNGTVTLTPGGNVLFTPDPNYFGPASFTYTADDGNGGQTVATVSVQVVSVNDLAVLDLDTGGAGSGYSTGYTENGAGIFVVDSTVSILDIDSTILTGATVTLTNGQVGDLLEISPMPAGITATKSPGGIVSAPNTVVTITLTGSATLADYQTALRAISFRSASDAPSTINRVIDITVNDGFDDSNTATTMIAITAVNDAPIAVDDTLSLTEDTPRTFTNAELTGNDIDPDLDTLTIVSVAGATNGTVILNGDGTVTFTPPADYFGPASFTYTIDDGNGLQSTATVNLTVTAVDDPAFLDLDTGTAGTDFTTSYVEDGPSVRVLDPSVSITDIDSTTMSGATVTLTNAQVGDILENGPLPGGITATVTPPGPMIAAGVKTLTLSGVASIADYEAALSVVVYRTLSDTPSTVNRMLTITVNDGASDSNVTNTTIAVTVTNDAPVAVDDGPFTLVEDTPLVLAPAAVLFNDSDPDGDPLTLISVQGASGGTVSINPSGNIVFLPNAGNIRPSLFHVHDAGFGGRAIHCDRFFDHSPGQ